MITDFGVVTRGRHAFSRHKMYRRCKKSVLYSLAPFRKLNRRRILKSHTFCCSVQFWYYQNRLLSVYFLSPPILEIRI